jgi:hypothetical protein
MAGQAWPGQRPPAPHGLLRCTVPLVDSLAVRAPRQNGYYDQQQDSFQGVALAACVAWVGDLAELSRQIGEGRLEGP